MTGSGSGSVHPSEPPAHRGTPGGWGELLGPRYLSTALVLAGGVALYAINVYLTAAIMPTAILEIGGSPYYAWVMTVFLTASIIASMLVTRALGRWGAATAYTVGFLAFALGALAAAVSPSMLPLLLARAVQGLGGGLLAGLGFAVLRAALPPRLWTRATGLVSAMWGVGNLLGPALGGVFAQWGAWRGSFVLLAVLALILTVLTRRALAGTAPDNTDPGPVPVLALVLITAAAGSFSLASVLPRGPAMLLGVLAGVACVVLFLLVDGRSSAGVLPRITYERGNALKWVYLALAALSAGAMTEAFVPLFGQELGGLEPVWAGFLGAAISIGWTGAQLISVNVEGARGRRRLMVLGPALLAAGLFSYALLQADNAAGLLIAAWAAALVAAGAGIGMAFPHLSVAAMNATDDPVEGRKAAAGVSTIQLIANAVASSLVGILVNLGGPEVLGSARLMIGGITVVAVLGLLSAVRATRIAARLDPETEGTGG